MRCPHCGCDFDEPVEDFTIPGRLGADSAVVDTCFDCDKPFTVSTPDGLNFTIEK